MTTKADMEVWRGDNSPPMIWRFPFDISGSDFALTIRTKDGDRRLFELRSTDSELSIDLDAREVSWAPTAEETAKFPKGLRTYYRLRRIIQGGEIRTYASGEILGRGEVNDA